MGDFAGVAYKEKKIGTVGQALKTMTMRYEIKGLTRDESREKVYFKKFIKASEKFELGEEEKDQKAINHHAERATDESYRLIMNDLILLRVLQRSVIEVYVVNRNIIKKTHNERLEDINKGIRKDWSIINGYLQTAQKQLFNLMNATSSRTAYGLMMKEVGFIDISIFNYLVMRIEANVIAKDLKYIQGIRDEAAKIYVKFKKGQASAEEMAKFIGHAEKLVKEIKKGAKNVFKLFTRNNLLMAVVIEKLTEAKTFDEKLMAKHEIPVMMGQVDIAVKKRILNKMRTHLKTEWRSVQQEARTSLG